MRFFDNVFLKRSFADANDVVRATREIALRHSPLCVEELPPPPAALLPPAPLPAAPPFEGCTLSGTSATPSTVLVVSFPSASSVCGFSTTTVVNAVAFVPSEPPANPPALAPPLLVPASPPRVPAGGTAPGCPTALVMKLHEAHFTELAPYANISTRPHPPQCRCVIWLLCIARLTVEHTEHCTDDANRVYMSSVRHPPHTSCAISVPGGGTAVMVLQSAQRTLFAPCG